ncbi:AsmA family protein [Massilia sp. H-1]|nr:AsmA family protein [Massilia sp. H-1]
MLYTALGFLAVPAVLTSQAQSLASDKLHRKLSIAKVDFNPFTLALSIDGLKLMEPQGSEVFVSTERLAVNLSWQSLWRLAPVIEQLRVSKPYVHLVRDKAGHYSIDDILALIASTPPSPEPARFSVNNIAIDGGQIVFDDQPASSIHKVDALRLGIPSLSSMPKPTCKCSSNRCSRPRSTARRCCSKEKRARSPNRATWRSTCSWTMWICRATSITCRTSPPSRCAERGWTRDHRQLPPAARTRPSPGAGRTDWPEGHGPVGPGGQADAETEDARAGPGQHRCVCLSKFDLARIAIDGLDATVVRDAA